MYYDYSGLWLSLPGIFIIGNALRGMVRKNLTTFSRGRRRQYQGSAAIGEACFQIAFGFSLVAFALLTVVMSAHA